MPSETNSDPLHRAQDLTLRVYQQHRKQLFAFLRRRLRHPHDTEDVQQEVYMRLLRVPDPELVENPQGLMFSIAAHAAYEFIARAKQAVVTIDSEAAQARDEHPAPEHVVADPLTEQLLAKERLERVLSRMQPIWRRTFLLHRIQGYSHAQVAEKLGITTFMVREYMHRAINVLREDVLDMQRQPRTKEER